MPLTRQDKEQQVAALTEVMKDSAVGVLVNYCGLTVAEVTELRKQCREANVEFKVYKNSVLRFSSENAGYADIATYLEGPNAIAIGKEDPVAAAKVIVEFAKTHEKLQIKAGYVDGKIASINELNALASLPSREILLSKILGGFNAPVSGLANALQGTIRNVAYALSAYAEKLQA